MVGWGKWASGELALWFIIITRSVQIPSNYLSYIYLLHKLLVHFFILFFLFHHWLGCRPVGCIMGFFATYTYIFTEIWIKTSVCAFYAYYFTFTHTGIMKIIFICLLLPLLMNPAVILDSCTQYAYPNTKILCTACREGYYLKYGVCFSC